MVRGLGTALSAIYLISSLTTTNALTIERRAGVVPSTLPGSWVSQGCYTDVGRTLTGGGYTDDVGMTDESCINYCSSAGFIYAGTEYSQECYCGNSLTVGAAAAPATDCSMTCTGNATEACGGPGRLNLFWSGTTGPQTNPGIGGWQFSGCYTEGTTGRALPIGGATTGGAAAMTVDLCLSACQTAGYLLAGVEYAGECYCGNAISNGATLAPEGLAGCSMLCNGNHSEYCGAGSRLDVYNYQNQVSLPPYTTTTTKASTTSTTAAAQTSTSTTVSTSKTSTSSVSSTKTSTSTSKTSTSTSKASTTTSKTSTSSVSTKTSTSTSKTSTSTSKASTTTSKTSTSTSKASTSTSKTSTSSVSSTKTSTSTSKTSTSTSKTSTSSTVTSNTSKSSTTTVPTTLSTSTAVGTTTSATSTSATSTLPSAAPTLGIKTTVGGYTYQGCYTEATGIRALTPGAFFDYTAMTLEECATSCAGYTYFGVEYGGECYCGNTINTGSVLAPVTDCSFTCPGNAYEYCGAGNRLEMYKLTSLVTSSSSSSTGTSTTGTSAAGTSTTGTSTTGTSTTKTSTSATTTATGWVYQGCYVDGLTGRDLNFQQPDNNANTAEACQATCASLGYTIAGMEYAVQCFCDNFLYNGAALAADQTSCNTPCPGNSAEMCGAGNRLSVYSSNGAPKVYQPPAAQTAGLPSGWVYKGCLQDNIPAAEDANQIVSTFPYMVWNNASNTPEACLKQCQAFGYNAAGLEYGSQCFCGDVANILVASQPGVDTSPNAVQFYTRSRTPQIVADSQCDSVCSGNASYLCGSGNLLTYYAFEGPTPLYTFNFPTGTAAGEYSLLIGGVVVPLMTTQGINGKAQFIEKYGSGEPNGTGAYELDLTEINNWSLAWRTMSGMDTDVFCSAGVTLPDKAGRILTVGGWAGESNFGVRLYAPDGSAGVFGTNQWMEDNGVLSLQVPRWYPSAMVMANGSVMIIGGEIGSNAAQQPTLELLPATGVPDTTTVSGYSNTTVYLDFLERTAPFNLYPFVCVVPSGIFIAYFNEARILDETTFATKKTLPNMPAAVNDPTGGRTYQLEGAMVLLPQYAPYTANLGVLICGGSTSNGGYPIDNCITTQPEDANPVWTIERMPSRRVMPCMAGLPDGTYVILNGGQHGVAGFGLGGDPNYNAVLYDPTKPLNSRMSIMANTTVARLYHSEAIVLLDGRVMITGSDPTGDYAQPAGEWPEEYRVEVFTPPYLLSGAQRPTFTLSSTDWAYGDTITVTVNVPSGNAANIKISMLGSVVSTHGNAMGQRTIFPAVTCSSATTCTVTAPPTAHIAPPGWFMFFVLDGPTPAVGQFVRIGKDPASIGNWPAGVAAFAPLPGV